MTDRVFSRSPNVSLGSDFDEKLIRAFATRSLPLCAEALNECELGVKS